MYPSHHKQALHRPRQQLTRTNSKNKPYLLFSAWQNLWRRNARIQLTAVFRDFSLYFLSMSQYVMNTNKYGGLEGTVAPAGTSSHKALTVLGDEWESTLVAMFVTSSYGHILPKELANNVLLPPTKNTCICFWGGHFVLVLSIARAQECACRKEGFGLCCFCEEHTRFVPLCR